MKIKLDGITMAHVCGAAHDIGWDPYKQWDLIENHDKHSNELYKKARKEAKAGPPKALIAKIPYSEMEGRHGLGKVGLKKIVDWLAEDGLSMPGTPPTVDKEKAKIEAAIELLTKYGYTVVKRS